MDTLNEGCKFVIFFILFEKYRRGNVFREDFSREGFIKKTLRAHMKLRQKEVVISPAVREIFWY